MRSALGVLLSAVLLAFLMQPAGGQEPAKKAEIEKIPAPKQQLPPQILPPVMIMPDMPRPETRAGWQYYGVDSFGRFRPRVILSPYGSYYMRNLEPYPWTTNRSTRFMPYVAD